MGSIVTLRVAAVVRVVFRICLESLLALRVSKMAKVVQVG